jgi:hypothetical protein
LDDARAAARAKLQDEGKAVDMLPEIVTALGSSTIRSTYQNSSFSGGHEAVQYTMQVDRRPGSEKFEIVV